MTATPLLRFHRTGERPDGVPAPPSGLRPALLARYLDLDGLRHDYPLVLVDDPDRPVRPLTEVVDDLLRGVAPEGASGERIRQHVLRLETAIRRAVSGGATGASLREVWTASAADLLGATADERLAESLCTAGAALDVDGVLVACTREAPAVVVRHLLTVAQRDRLDRIRAELRESRRRLLDVLEADHVRSPAGRTPDRLRASVGGTHQDDFDFDAWSELLGSRPYDGGISEARRARLEWVVETFDRQGLVDTDATTADPERWVFDGCASAAEAHERRLPELLRLVKASSIARLELDHDYDEATHDGFFHAFDTSLLEAGDLDALPPSLVVVDGDGLDLVEHARILSALTSSLPWKVLVVWSDVVGPDLLDDPVGPRAPSSPDLTRSALGIGTAHVVQTTVAGLARMADAVTAALAARGPALVSIATADSVADGALPMYLAAAAATEARAVVDLAFDPSTGDDWTERLRLPDQPDATEDWPVRGLTYEDEDLQRVDVDVAFTFADLVAADPRARHHTALAPRDRWDGVLVPVAELLTREPAGRDGLVPYVLAVGDDDVLRRLVVDRRVVDATLRRREAWRQLQGLAGLRESRERRLLEEERAALASERAAAPSEVSAPPTADVPAPDSEVPSLAGEPAGGGPEALVVAAEPAVAPDVETPPTGEAWIETARCTTCDECTDINPRMFVYDENKQARIADLAAGTFRELVEAAESCQVAIIHPGDPWDTSEPGLDDLRRRAAAFT